MQRSEEINSLAEALAKAQGVMQPVKKDKSAKIETKSGSAYSYAYADLADVLDAIRKPLSDNGLALIQASSIDGGKVEVETTLAHTSGQWVSNTIALPMSNPDPRSLGSLITYGRRYGLAIVGVVTDEDDDAGSASRQVAKPTAKPAQPRPQTPTEAAHAQAAEADFASIPSAQQERGNGGDKPHWIDDGEVRKRFWSWCNQHDLSKDDVHMALDVLHVQDYAGTMAEAKVKLTAYYNRRLDAAQEQLVEA